MSNGPKETFEALEYGNRWGKEKHVTIKVDARAAAAVRQVLFEAQKGYTYDEVSVPPRIADIRSVVQQLDDSIGAVLGV